jgi:hypothetical protein
MGMLPPGIYLVARLPSRLPNGARHLPVIRDAHITMAVAACIRHWRIGEYAIEIHYGFATNHLRRDRIRRFSASPTGHASVSATTH